MQLTRLNSTNGVQHVWCEGEIIQDDFASVRDPLLEVIRSSDGNAHAQTVALDMSGATFLGSAGVGWLVRCHNLFTKAGGFLIIHSIPVSINNVLVLLKMDEVLNLALDLPEAHRKIDEHAHHPRKTAR